YAEETGTQNSIPPESGSVLVSWWELNRTFLLQRHTLPPYNHTHGPTHPAGLGARLPKENRPTRRENIPTSFVLHYQRLCSAHSHMPPSSLLLVVSVRLLISHTSFLPSFSSLPYPFFGNLFIT